MKTLTPKKKDSNTVVVTVDPTKVSRGHWARPSGAGKHMDKRDKRARTRGAAFRKAMAY